MEMVDDGKIKLVLSPQIIDEYSRVLQYDEIKNKITQKKLEMQLTLYKIVAISTLVKPTEILKIVQEDPDDNAILECAVEGNVNYVVSSDKHLLSLGSFRGIKIVTPEDFLTFHRS